MQKNKRLRVFAGPNGSGKSTLFDEFKKLYDPGYFINADEIEKQLCNNGLIELQNFGLKATNNEFVAFMNTKETRSLIVKSLAEGYNINIELKKNCIFYTSNDSHSYEASFVAAFIRWLLLKNGKSFSFETVMSHYSKIEEIKMARRKGYKTYLYFVCTDNPEINVSRVSNRVVKGGHQVDDAKIRSRYPETLQNLYPAIKLSNRAYLFDNSGKELLLIAEVYEGLLQLKITQLPQWFLDYVLPNFQQRK